MYINLAGEWQIFLEADAGMQSGNITLPGILQGNGYGNPITTQTPWISTLHDSFWFEQEEYKYAQEDGVNVPFLSQPPRHFMGQAVYVRNFEIAAETDEDWHFFVEAARWKSEVWIDGVYKGEVCTLCAPHHMQLGRLDAGTHEIKVIMDNSELYPYRPDAHGVSDALGATWNGMVGEMALFTESEWQERENAKKQYAAEHPVSIEARDGKFYREGKPFYFRATHMGGEYPLTGYPVTDREWWRRIMKIQKEWGLNGIRFHSYCPPEAAFAVADEEDMLLLVECGMWNHFEDTPDGEEMFEVLRREARLILENFGHHPSFVFFSSSNEPGGAWHQPLRRWVSETREYDKSLGYGGRRIYTAESGWHYEVPPAEITGTDFIYFHRSGYGPFMGGTIRNPKGWRGGDYSVSLEGVKLPVVCHELGQICAYPNYDIIDKYTGYLQPGNYKVFRECARANGILPYADDFVKCSGENQLRLYKEELEANFRTPEIQGFELLDLHDYLGQGTALVGILDAFWENKGYGDPAEFRNYCSDTVMLARIRSYVWKNTDKPEIPMEVCHYGDGDVENAHISWRLIAENSGETTHKVLQSGTFTVDCISTGGNTQLGTITLSFEDIKENSILTLEVSLNSEKVTSKNSWKLHVFVEEEAQSESGFVYTRDWAEAKSALFRGERVVFVPYLSELNFECPALSGRSVMWNSQMGPTWARTMGVVVQEQHPIFKHFPTEHSGGWQWADILSHGRGFHMEGLTQIRPIVQPIDDWNRNLLQGLIFEAKVLSGSLLVACVDWEGAFEKRPEAHALKQAVLKYAASEAFHPDTDADVEAIEDKFFPMTRMRYLTDSVNVDCDGRLWNEEGIVEADPNSSIRIHGGNFPISITISLKKAVEMQGIVYVPEQRDRAHAGFAKEFVLEVCDGDGSWIKVCEGRFLNGCRSQRILFEKMVMGDKLRLTVLSAYGCEAKEVWQETNKGWFKVAVPEMAMLQIGGLHLVCDEEVPYGDSFAANREVKSRTKEIDM